MLGYKISLEDLRRLKSYQAFFSNQNYMKLENQLQLILKKNWKAPKYVELKTHT